MEAETTIDLLRHGECEGGQIYRGSTDVALSKKGWQQMERSAAKVSLQWQAVVSSPLQRCALFSQRLSHLQGIPLDIKPDLRETFFGDWEGQRVDTVWRDHRAQAEQWYSDPLQFSPPNGEPTTDFIQRVETAFADIVSTYRGKHVGLVIHGGVIRVLLSHVLVSPFHGFGAIDVPFACLTRIGIWHSDDGYSCQLQFHNPMALPLA